MFGALTSLSEYCDAMYCTWLHDFTALDCDSSLANLNLSISDEASLAAEAVGCVLETAFHVSPLPEPPRILAKYCLF
jgi:hypothetical protein